MELDGYELKAKKDGYDYIVFGDYDELVRWINTGISEEENQEEISEIKYGYFDKNEGDRPKTKKTKTLTLNDLMNELFDLYYEARSSSKDPSSEITQEILDSMMKAFEFAKSIYWKNRGL